MGCILKTNSEWQPSKGPLYREFWKHVKLKNAMEIQLFDEWFFISIWKPTHYTPMTGARLSLGSVFRRIIFRECIFCCGQWPALPFYCTLFRRINAARVAGGNGPVGGLLTPCPVPPSAAVLAANIEYFCRVVKLGYARVTTNQWAVMYDCLLPHALHNKVVFSVWKLLIMIASRIICDILVIY